MASYEKKRYVLPVGLLALIIAMPGGDEDAVDINEVSTLTSADSSSSPRPTADAAAADKAAATRPRALVAAPPPAAGATAPRAAVGPPAAQHKSCVAVRATGAAPRRSTPGRSGRCRSARPGRT